MKSTNGRLVNRVNSNDMNHRSFCPIFTNEDSDADRPFIPPMPLLPLRMIVA
jgi:hypothetical protein